MGIAFTKRTLPNGLVASAVALLLFAGCKTGSAHKSSGGKRGLTSGEAFDIAVEAYIFGYPLVTMDMTRRVMTNVRAPQGLYAPMGQFALTRTYPLPSNHEVAMPNADTLYTAVWLDVSREPWVLSIPDTKGHYTLFSMLDGWTTVFGDPGKRTTGTGPQKCAITGPGWKGKLPAGLKQYKSPTRHRVGARPRLLRGHAGRLCRRACDPGPVLGGAAQRLRKALYAAAGTG